MGHYLLDLLELNREAKIKRWLDEFNENEKSKFKKHFKDKQNLTEFQNELAIGHLLKKSGFDIVYEKKVDGLKPDFFINQKNCTPAFILEVRTLNSEQNINNLEREWKELKRLIRQLKYPVKLKIELNYDVDDNFVTPFININKILQNIIDWLNSEDRVENFIIVDDFIIRIIDDESLSDSIVLESSSSFGYKSKEDRFTSAINEKKEKYIKLINDYNLPYVIGIFNTFSSRIEHDQIEGIFLGKKINYIIPDSESPPEYNREKPKIYAENIKSVSGILVFEYVSNRWGIQYFDNSKTAQNKLTPNIFDKLLSFNNIPDEKIDDFLEGNYKPPSLDDLFK